MAGAPVCFVLAGGETINLAEGDLPRVYDALWELNGESGAISTAALLLHAWHEIGALRYVELTRSQTDVFRKAMNAGS